ncbi:MAG: aminoacyl-tRNA hydrolase [Flavobacteriales bacterium]|nr:aminoacyl-tRNA hydrolase [Flavobacteriales bacterium]
MKYLIAGLGNPGSEYTETRHNVGFKTLDALARASNVVFSPAKHGETCLVKHKGRQLILLKPNTFMNLSGKAVRYWLTQEKISILNLLVVTDDLALPFGALRLKTKGSDGGHNGLKSINEVLNTKDYSRLRFGIGNEFSKGRQVDYVLGRWGEEELKSLDLRTEMAGEMILSFAAIGPERTMSAYNKK